MIGNFLRKAREKKGLTLKDIEKDTSIRAYYLEALEKEEYTSLPGEAYVKGFLRSYAEAVGLDGDDLIKRYREEQEDYIENIDLNEQNTVESTGVFTSGEDFKARMNNAGRTRSLLTVVAVLFLLFVGSIYYFFGASDDKKMTKAKETIGTIKAKEASTKSVNTSSADKKIAGVTGENKEAEKLELVAKLTNNCWLQVIADGKVIHEATGVQGDMFTFKAKDKLSITAGNAGAVEIFFNGKTLGLLGKPGEVVEKFFDKNGEIVNKKRLTKK